jgi:hypothetical protein
MTEPADFVRCAAAYPHHPAMERMATPSFADYDTLKRSVKEHGLRVPLILFVEPNGKEWLIDGRSRVKAMEELGIPVVGTDRVLDTTTVHCAEDGREWTVRCERFYADQDADPDKIVADLNLARRQLTVEQKRTYIANLLKAFPERSNNSIAGIAGVSDHTVASIRATLETTSQIAKLSSRIGADGKTRAMPSVRRPASARNAPPINEGEPPSKLASATDKPIPVEVSAPKDVRPLRVEQLIQIDFPPPEELIGLAATDPVKVARFVGKLRAWLGECDRRIGEWLGKCISSC